MSLNRVSTTPAELLANTADNQYAPYRDDTPTIAALNEMASTNRKPPASTQAEVALLPGLKNCLLNLPASLVNVLLNSNAVVQNVVVELSFRQAAGSDGKPGKQSSVFLGWTGMRSQTRRAGPRQEQEVPGVEVDGTFGRLLGLREGMKVRMLFLTLFWSCCDLLIFVAMWLIGLDG